jgi:uncharacterized C2H2 Zn-finger protein
MTKFDFLEGFFDMAKPILRCPLCGKEFVESEMKCTSGCLLSKNCNLLCCPNCGYTFKEQSAIVDFLKTFWKRKAKQ